MRVTVSQTNKKMGCPSFSLLPIVTCDRRMPCAKTRACYACHMEEYRKTSVRISWTRNTEAAAQHPLAVADSISSYLSLSGNPRRFRWFVGGDIPVPSFLDIISGIASKHSETTFLLFTKRYRWTSEYLDQHERPTNLNIYLSAWPGVRLYNPHQLPVAWLADRKHPDKRIPGDVGTCPAFCPTCLHCWKPDPTDIVFAKHR